MKNRISFVVMAIALVVFPGTAVLAHFGMVIPSANIITQANPTTNLELSFSHPCERIGMKLEKPDKFYVIHEDKVTDLLPTLSPLQVMNHKSWASHYRFQRPGVYQFVMEPQPYWEPTEDLFIIHYTKTIVAAYGDDQDWDKPAGVKTEIVPMLRPFGNYAGNSFTGQVLLDGKAVPFAEVEVELYNRLGTLHPPSEFHITQTVKADGQGVFTFTCPLAGWWGFSALSEADYTIKGPGGAEKGVELGAVLWVFFDAIHKGN
jgi:cobalt/nickel transport protein